MGFPDSCMQLQFQVATIVICFFRLTHTVEFLIHMNSWETNDEICVHVSSTRTNAATKGTKQTIQGYFTVKTFKHVLNFKHVFKSIPILENT